MFYYLSLKKDVTMNFIRVKLSVLSDLVVNFYI